MNQWRDVSPVPDLCLFILNFTRLLASSTLPQARAEPTLLLVCKSSPAFDHSPSRGQQSRYGVAIFLQNPSRPNVGEKQQRRQPKRNTATAVSIENQLGGMRSSVQWEWSRLRPFG